MDPTPIKPLPPASLLRRLGAMLYDGLLLLALLFLATAAWLPLTGGEAIEPGNPFYSSYLFLLCFGFFAWFWTHGGQTLGMRAWRIQIRRVDGGPVGLWHALLRFLIAFLSWAVFGLGFVWSLVDRQGRSWHDIYSETQLVVLPRSK